LRSDWRERSTTSCTVKSVLPFSMMIACAASRKRWTRCAARNLAVLIDRSTARCFQAGSSLGLVTGGSDNCREGRTWLDSTGERRVIGVPPRRATTCLRLQLSLGENSILSLCCREAECELRSGTAEPTVGKSHWPHPSPRSRKGRRAHLRAKSRSNSLGG